MTISTACCSGMCCLGLTRSSRNERRNPSHMSFIFSARAAISVFCASDQVFVGPNSSRMSEKRNGFSEIQPKRGVSEVAGGIRFTSTFHCPFWKGQLELVHCSSLNKIKILGEQNGGVSYQFCPRISGYEGGQDVQLGSTMVKIFTKARLVQATLTVTNGDRTE
jgi:hypothetical protein